MKAQNKYFRQFFYFFIWIFATFLYLATNRIYPNSIDPAIFLDNYIPLIPWTTILYHLWYPSLIFLVIKMKNNPELEELLLKFAIAMSACFITYKLIPAIVSVRPSIDGEKIFDIILRLTYYIDAPTSSLPSSHVVLALIAYHYAKKHNIKILRYYEPVIMFVTLTTKQHVIADVLLGIIYASVIIYSKKIDKLARFNTVSINFIYNKTICYK